MDERFIEYAERSVDAERDSAVRRACSTVASDGREDCVDCGEVLNPARRAAAPFAVRCLECQQANERGRRT